MSRPFIRRQWTAAEAETWTREDWIAIALSPIIFALLMIGLARLLFGLWDGALELLAAAIGIAVGYWVIDPKLRAVSVAYESSQAGYLVDLEQTLQLDASLERGGGK